MGHLQDMTHRQRMDFISMQYQRKLDANRGHNYQYYTEELEKKWIAQGYAWYMFENKRSMQKSDSIESEEVAQNAVKYLRSHGYNARIICGYDQNVQHIKMFSIIYKEKK